MKTIQLVSLHREDDRHEKSAEFRMTSSESDMIDKFCRKFFGENAFFWRNNSYPSGIYGQICRPVQGGGNTCLTGVVRFEIK